MGEQIKMHLVPLKHTSKSTLQNLQNPPASSMSCWTPV